MKKEDTHNKTCAICGDKLTKDNKNDIRPIKSNRGEYCCKECNKEVVVPTRKHIW